MVADLAVFYLCKTTSGTQTSRKQKYVQGNHMPFMMNNTPSKNIKKPSKLRNKILKDRTKKIMKIYTSQRNYCVSFLRKTKKEYFGGLSKINLSDN